MKDIKMYDSESAISIEVLDEFIIKYQLKLPESYKNFILKHNGGYAEICAFDNPNEDGTIVAEFCAIRLELGDFLEELDNIITVTQLIEDHQHLEKNLPAHLFPFALAEGGGKFCISMNEEDFGTIYLFFMDGTANEPIFVIDSFENFINALEDPAIFEEEE